MPSSDTVEKLISQVLHSLVFFEEFTFSSNNFKSTDGSELELADAVVVLDDILLVMQIKERSEANFGNPIAEQKWFERKVVGKATKQIRDTLKFLKAHGEIPIENNRGRNFQISFEQFSEIPKFVVYRAGPDLPEQCLRKKFHISESAGFIHLIEAEEYLNVAQFLRVPEEIIRYFRYREMILTNFPTESSSLPEASLLGGYIGEEDESPPAFESFENLHLLYPDDESWDIAEYLRSLRDHYSDPNYNDDYYAILKEFVRLPRSMWREFKKRLVLCVENVQTDTFAQPYRVSYPDRSIGFMLFGADSGFTSRDDWETYKQQGLITFTQLHKFDQKLQKCIGLSVSKTGEYFDIQWCMIDHEWEENLEVREKLNKSSPFRPVKESEQFSYFLSEKSK